MTEPSALELAERIETNPLGWLPVVGDVINVTFTPEEARLLVAALRAPPAQGEPVVTPSDIVEVLENVRAGIEKIKQTKILSGGPGYIDASFVPIEIYKACHSLEHLTRGLRS